MKTLHFSFLQGLLIGSLFLLGSCRTLNLVELTPEDKNERLLPALHSEIDVSVLESMNVPATVSTTEFLSEDEEAMTDYPQKIQTVTEPRYLNQTSNDFLVLFNRDVQYNITNPVGEKKGSIVCRVAALNQDESGFALSFISACSFGLLNLVGFPFAMVSSSVDIDVAVYDEMDRLVSTYHAVGNAKVASAMYYGYQISSAVRLAKIKSFKKAMNKVKSQIDVDYDRLSIALK